MVRNVLPSPSHEEHIRGAVYQVLLVEYVLYCTRIPVNCYLPVPPTKEMIDNRDFNRVTELGASTLKAIQNMLNESSTSAEKSMVIMHPAVRTLTDFLYGIKKL